MRLTGTLYVTDHRARIRLRKGTLLVEQTAGWQRIPIETVDGVVLTGRAEISNDAIGELVRRRIRIAALSKTGRLRFCIGGPAGGNVHLRVAQHEHSSSPTLSDGIARTVVAGKLQNCRRSMQRWMWEGSELTTPLIQTEVQEIAGCIQALIGLDGGDRIRGVEGDGSRRYFKCLGIHLGSTDPPIVFGNRNRRPPRNEANALLGFTYGLLLTELIGAAEAVGLDPQIGFLHRPRSGRPSLALDLLEELRPAVADRFAVAALRKRQIRSEHFTKVGGACYLSDEGREALLELWEAFRSEEVEHKVLGRSVGRWAIPTVQATLMARYLRGDLPAYPPYVAP